MAPPLDSFVSREFEERESERTQTKTLELLSPRLSYSVASFPLDIALNGKSHMFLENMLPIPPVTVYGWLRV